MSNLTPAATLVRAAFESQAIALRAKGWTMYHNAYGYEKWVSPDKTAVMPLHAAIECQALADYYNIEFAVL
jgi:hypothetical protein